MPSGRCGGRIVVGMTHTSTAETTRESAPPALPVRQRLLDALAECLEQHDYAAITVADIVQVARTSRRSFYQEFADKQACFVELLRASHEVLITTIAARIDAAAPWRTQIRQAVEAYVSVTENNPGMAKSFIRELPALGAPARSIQVDAMESLIAVLVPLTDTAHMRAEGIEPMSHDAGVLMWGGICALAADALDQGRSLWTIVEPLVAFCIGLVGTTTR